MLKTIEPQCEINQRTFNKWRGIPCSWIRSLNIIKINCFQIDIRI